MYEYLDDEDYSSTSLCMGIHSQTTLVNNSYWVFLKTESLSHVKKHIHKSWYVCTKMNLISHNMLLIPFCRLIVFANLLRFYQTLCPKLFSKGLIFPITIMH